MKINLIKDYGLLIKQTSEIHGYFVNIMHSDVKIMMIRHVLFMLISVLAQYTLVMAQEAYDDKVYLKTGTVVVGKIIENVSDNFIKIQSRNGSVYNFNFSEIDSFKTQKTSKLPNILTQSNKKDTLTETKEVKIESYNRLFVGYFGSIPNAPVGFAIGFARRDKIGFFFGIKFPNEDPGLNEKEFYENISENKARNIFGDKQTDDRTTNTCLEVDLINRISRGIFYYCGLGYNVTTNYLRFYDKYEILGDQGNYWIEKNVKKSITVNGGIIIFVENGPYFQVGFDTSPGGLNLGIGFFLESSLF